MGVVLEMRDYGGDQVYFPSLNNTCSYDRYLLEVVPRVHTQSPFPLGILEHRNLSEHRSGLFAVWDMNEHVFNLTVGRSNIYGDIYNLDDFHRYFSMATRSAPTTFEYHHVRSALDHALHAYHLRGAELAREALIERVHNV